MHETCALLVMSSRCCRDNKATASTGSFSHGSISPGPPNTTRHHTSCIPEASPEVDSRQNYSRIHTSNLTEFVSASVTLHFCSMILKSLDLRHVNDDSNTN